MRSDSGESEAISCGEDYELLEHKYSTRTSECHLAIHKPTNERVLFWNLRHPLGENSESLSRFIERLERVKRIHFAKPNFRAFGVGAGSKAYLVTDELVADPLLSVRFSNSERQKFFVQAVSAVAALHEHDILLGDICEHSFLVSSDGQLNLVALLGNFEMEGVGNNTFAASKYLGFYFTRTTKWLW